MAVGVLVVHRTFTNNVDDATPRVLDRLHGTLRRDAAWCDQQPRPNRRGDRPRDRGSVSRYLDEADDWIVLNSSMATLANWAKTRPELAAEITPHLERISQDNRKSVANRAAKALAQLAAV